MNQALRRWAPLLVVVGLLTLTWILAGLSTPQVTSVPRPSLELGTAEPEPESALTSPPPLEPSPALPEASSDTSSTITAIVVAVAVVAVGAVTAWLFLRDRSGRRRRSLLVGRPRPGLRRPDDGGSGAVEAAVDAGLSGLVDGDVDPRRAVIACWVRLEQAAAASGTPRHVGDSPTDLVTRLLARHQVSQPVLDQLAAVYHEARYAAHVIDERMPETAAAALRQVRAELRSSRPAPEPAEVGR